MSGRKVKVTVDQNTYEVDESQADEILSDAKAANKKASWDWADENPAGPNPLLQQTPPSQIADAAAPDAPKPTPTPVEPGTWKDTAADAAVGGLGGVSLGWDDELVGLFRGDAAKQDWRARQALAQRRSPVATGATKFGAGLVPAAAALTFTGPVGGAAAMGALGAAAGAGEDHDNRLNGAVTGGAFGLGGGALGALARGAGAGARWLGRGLINNAASPDFASKAAAAAAKVVGKGAGAAAGGALAGTSLPGAFIAKDAVEGLVTAAAKPALEPLITRTAPQLTVGVGKTLHGIGGALRDGGRMLQQGSVPTAQISSSPAPDEPAIGIARAQDRSLAPAAVTTPNWLAGIAPAHKPAAAVRQYPQSATPKAPARSGASVDGMVRDLSGSGQRSSAAMSALDRVQAELQLEPDPEKRKAKYTRAILTDPMAREAFNSF